MIREDELKLAFLSCGIKQRFNSLGSCMDHLQEIYKPVADGPSYLFRGESGIFDTTHSGRARIEIDFHNRLEYDIEKFAKLTNYCAGELVRLQPHLSPSDVIAYLQHYGLPTYGLSLTSDLTAAAYFGSFGETNRIKLIAVINKEKLLATRGTLTRLDGGAFGQRPDKQHAVITHIEPRDNLKSPGLACSLGIQWYSFTLTKKDQSDYNTARGDLLEGDAASMSIVPFLIRQFEIIHGKVHRKIKNYYAYHLSKLSL